MRGIRTGVNGLDATTATRCFRNCSRIRVRIDAPQLFPDGLEWTLVESEAGRLDCTTWNGVPVTLTNHFVSRSFNTNAQLDAFAKIALRKGD